MPEFDHLTLAIVDDTRDREQASDGHSRYGAYLAQHAHRFGANDEQPTIAEFAVAAWTVATAPVMAPGYVTVRPDLLDLAPVTDHDGGLRMRARVALRHAALAHRSTGRLADWQHNPWAWSDEQWPPFIAPGGTDGPALLVTAEVSVPVPAAMLSLPTTARPGRTLTYEAKMATSNLLRLANDHLAPLVAELLGGTR